jgi:hypothetical protein
MFAVIGNKSVKEKKQLKFTISATDPDDDDLTYSASNLPDGADFDPATHTFSWTPDSGQAGSYTNVHFEVSDGDFTDEEDITITVKASSTSTGGSGGGSSDGGGSSGGGGGGGGGGGSSVGSNGTRFTNVLLSRTNNGTFIEDVLAQSVDNKVELGVPENTVALNQNGQPLSSIYVKDGSTLPLLPPYCEIVGKVYELGPSGTTFSPPVDLTFKYTDAEVPQGVAEKNLILASYDWATEKWQNLESNPDPKNNSVTTRVNLLATYAILAYTHPASFKVTELTAIPQEIELGKGLGISARITNTGDLTGSYELKLRFDDTVVQTKTITLDGGDSETVLLTATPETAGQHQAAIGNSLATFTVKAPLTPAAFTTSEPVITPPEVTLGENVNIGILVANTGDLPGTYQAVLQIDDIPVQTREIALDVGQSEMVTFTVTTDTVGQHRVNIDGLLGTFNVREPLAIAVSELPPANNLEISSFNIAPSYDTATGKLVSARIVYQMNQPADSFPDVSLTLKVFLDGQPLETIPLLTLSQLQSDGRTGDLGYIPSSGWQAGSYSFQAELNSGESPVQSTEPQQLTVTPEAITRVVSWMTLGMVIGATLAVTAAVVLIVLYRRRFMLRDYID